MISVYSPYICNSQLRHIQGKYKINSYISFDKKDQMKFEFGIKNLEAIGNNHLENLKELPKQKWKTESFCFS